MLLVCNQVASFAQTRASRQEGYGAVLRALAPPLHRLGPPPPL
jgi:hypothetical protein